MKALVAVLVAAVAVSSVNAVTLERDIEALKLLKQEVENRDPYWAGAVASWQGGGPNGEDDPCGSSWKGNWHGVECRLQGDLPPATPRVVTNLHIPDRLLSGPVPLSIALLGDLIEIDLDGNKLTGPLNPYLGCLTKMRELDLANNTLTGTLPDQWKFMENLEEVEVHHNPSLTGCIPQGMPPTQTVCREPANSAARQFAQNFIQIGAQPICELIGTTVMETAVDGFCPNANLEENTCANAEFVRNFIAEGMDYDKYYTRPVNSQGVAPVAPVQTLVPPQPAIQPAPADVLNVGK